MDTFGNPKPKIDASRTGQQKERAPERSDVAPSCQLLLEQHGGRRVCTGWVDDRGPAICPVNIPNPLFVLPSRSKIPRVRRF